MLSSRPWLVLENSHTVTLEDNLSLRIYADSRPRNLEIALLHKGLVLMLNGRELIEEGVGFGVPVAIFSDKTYFSSTARVTVSEDEQSIKIMKCFRLDTVSRKGLKDGAFVDNSLYRLFSDFLASTYREHSASRRIIFPLIWLRNKIGIKTFFTRVEPRGEVTIVYKIRRNSVDIEASLISFQKQHCEKVLLLNEQGPTFFNRFHDSNGLSLTGNKIGAWDLIDADWACFSDRGNTLGFCLRNLPEGRLFRGTEQIGGRLGWAGMGYELNPNLGFFKYKVKICFKK